MKATIRVRVVASLSCGVAAAALLTACGGGASSAPASTSDAALLTYQGSDRTEKLAAAAKSEGTLNWTTSLAGPVVDAIANGFKSAYSGVNVTVNRGDEGTIIPQAVQAISAGKSISDVFEVTASGALELSDDKVLAAYETPAAAQIPSEYTVKKDNHTVLLTDRISYISFGYNKSKIPADAVPRSLQDLANPALKGKLAIETDTTSEDWVGAVLTKLGDADGKALLQKLAANGVAQTAQSGSTLMSLVASGQYGGSPSVFHNHEQQQAASGAPVDWVPLDPVVANVGQLGIFSNAQHPAAAMLFIDWLLGPDGQKVLEAQNYTPPTVKQPFTAWVPTEGASSAKDFNNKLKSWAAIQKQYFSK